MICLCLFWIGRMLGTLVLVVRALHSELEWRLMDFSQGLSFDC